MAATMRIPTEFTAIDKFTSVVSKMTSGVSNFSKSAISAVNRVNTKVNNLWSSLDGISQLAIGVGVAGLFTMASSAIMDYETALASLEAVTGESASTFKTQIEDIAKRTNKSAIEVAGAFEIIGSAMSQYLSDPKALGLISEAGITLSKASKMQLEPALQSLTSVMNQFNLAAEDANKTINVLTAGEIVGSVSTEKIATSLQEFGANAYAANVSLSESVALLETMGKQMDHSKIGVGARNLLSVMSSAKGLPKPAIESLNKHGVSMDVLMNKTLPLGARLKELSKVQGDAVAMVNIFGKENMTAAQVVFKNLGTYDEWQKKIETTNEAQKQAAVNSDTLSFAMDSIKNSFTNTLVSGDELNGALVLLKDGAFWLSENMDSVLAAVGGLLIAFGLLKAILIVSAIWTFISSVAMGIYGAVSGKASVNIGKNTIALGAYKTMQVLMTAGTWLATAAMTAFSVVMNLGLWPILAIVAGILALIAIFYYWDEIVAWFGKQWETFTNWISELWNSVVKWFTEFDFVGFFIDIGQAIIDYMLFPLKSVLKLVAMIPGGIGEAAQAGLDKLNEMSNLSVMLGRENGQVESPEVINAQNSKANTLNGNINMTVNDKQNNIGAIQTDFGGIGVNTTKTQGAF